MIRSIGNKSSCEWVAIRSEFEELQARLQQLEPELRQRLLLHFVRPGDHFLPLNVLRFSLDEIIGWSFDELRKTPGVGSVKIRNLLELFQRILREGPENSRLPAAMSDAAASATADSSGMTEIEWAGCCSRILQHGLEKEPIGRLVNCLGDLPRSVWHTPLGFYAELTLEQLRKLKSHGPRRIGSIIETFRTLNNVLAATESCRGAALTLGPEAIVGVNAWVIEVLLGRAELTAESFVDQLVGPLMVQLQFDAGEVACSVAAERIGKHFPGIAAAVPTESNVAWAERLSYSRLHQIRQDLAAVVRVRWPRGMDLCGRLAEYVGRLPAERGLAPIVEVLTTFFPGLKNRLAKQPAPESTAALSPTFPAAARNAAWNSGASGSLNSAV